LPLRAAILLTATTIAVPVLMFYDLMLVFVALVWVSRVHGVTGWRTLAMAAAFLGPLLSGNIFGDTHVPVAFATACLAFGLTVALAWRGIGMPRLTAPRAGFSEA